MTYTHEDGQGGDLNPAEEEVDGMAQGAGKEAEEVRSVRAPAVPILPSREEVLNHRLTHTPFRSWCPHCQRGKGRDDRHLKSPNKDRYEGIPQIVSDYFFVGRKRPTSPEERAADEDEAEKSGQTPIIVLKDMASKSLFAHACPRRGADERIVAKIVADLDALGYRRILVKTDGEPSIVNKVKVSWWGEVVKMESMVGDHNSNGAAEQAVQKIEDELRT